MVDEPELDVVPVPTWKVPEAITVVLASRLTFEPEQTVPGVAVAFEITGNALTTTLEVPWLVVQEPSTAVAV